ncbi:holdfast anchoring protein HfaA [Maricaulis sp.]|uniref:holdfast anchoring protein HfaA n=1 Tax=unclassified Maricaulis TaxID=2632371 RepID=UPI001B18B546|nr:holdfast anchoring protein HfaA [Maricaulis sp.]MBO6796932.1 holdfast anchoring protein HfaA [Maricaulis sp.]
MTHKRTRFLTSAIGLTMLAASAASAQSTQTTAQWERPYGVAYGQEQRPWSGATASAGSAARSSAGNRVIIDGVIQTGVGVSSQLNGLFGGGVGANATAIGNQLNVNVTGQWNTVIVNSTQINNGNVNANAQSNGETSEDNEEG